MKLECGLSNAGDWVKQTVKLTFEAIRGDAKVECTTEEGTFSCSEAKGTEKVLDAITPENREIPTADGDKVHMTAKNKGTETASFRCSVSVGDPKDDPATDTKLVYAQKIGNS